MADMLQVGALNGQGDFQEHIEEGGEPICEQKSKYWCRDQRRSPLAHRMGYLRRLGIYSGNSL